MRGMTPKLIFLGALGACIFLNQPEGWASAGAETDLDRLRSWAREAERSAKEWLEEILREDANGEVNRSAYLGVVVESVPRVLREHVDLPPGIGLLVRAVQPGSPAETGGLEANDILVAYRDQLLVNHEQLLVLLQLEQPEAVIDLRLLRRGEEKRLSVILKDEAEAAEPAG